MSVQRKMTRSDRRVLRDAATLLDENARIIWDSNTGAGGHFMGTSEDMKEYRQSVSLAVKLRDIADMVVS